MRHNPDYSLTDITAVRQLVEKHPFITLVSGTSHGLVASHYAVLVEDYSDGGFALVGHVGRPDETLHELGRHEVLVIAGGENGYISPSWYGDRTVPAVPTWNFAVAHLYGTPEILSNEENYRILGLLVDRFEDHVRWPRRMEGSPSDADYARRIAAGTVGFRIPVARYQAKAKFSQDKPEEVVAGVLSELAGDGPYANPALAQSMAEYRRAART